MLALFVGQPWTLLSESNDGVAGVPELLVVYLHPPPSHSRQQRVTRKTPGYQNGASLGQYMQKGLDSSWLVGDD
jgi:hypothetical protein